jgi:hypothetical protein
MGEHEQKLRVVHLVQLHLRRPLRGLDLHLPSVTTLFFPEIIQVDRVLITQPTRTHISATAPESGDTPGTGLRGRREGTPWDQPDRRILGIMKPSRAVTRRHLSTSPFNAPAAAPPLEQFAVQDRVSHDKYGLGLVIEVEDDVAVLVDFGTQRHRIPAPYAKLFKL